MVGPVPRILRFRHKVPSGDGTVDFETPVFGDESAEFVPTNVVEDGAQSVDFGIESIRGVEKVRGDHDAEEERAHNVVEGWEGEMLVSQFDGGVDEWACGDGDVGDYMRWEV